MAAAGWVSALHRLAEALHPQWGVEDLANCRAKEGSSSKCEHAPSDATASTQFRSGLQPSPPSASTSGLFPIDP